MVYVAYITELNLQICDYGDAFVANIVNTRLTKIFMAIFAPHERLPSSATLILIDISCISDWDLSLHSLSSDRPCFFLFWYKMNTHGMSIVAGYFMTVFQAKTWYRITFDLKPHEFKIFRSWTFYAPFCFRGVQSIFHGHYDDDDDMSCFL